MAAPPPSSVIQPHLSPLILTLSDPSLAQLLHRNHIPSLAHLLQPFQHSVDRVTVRSASYDNINLARFPVHFVERTLPPGFGQRADGTTGAGATAGGRARSGSLAAQSAGLAPPPRLSSEVSAGGAAPSPSTPFHHPSQAERDELFLDAVGMKISSRVEGWLSSPEAPAELDVQPISLRPRPGGDEEEGEGAKKMGMGDRKEGWEDKTVEELAPWFRELRDEVFARREMVEWETFAWPVGCILALSTTSPDPLNALSALWDLASPSSLYSPASYPPRSGAEEDGRHEWADAAGLVRFVVLVHDWGAGGGQEGWEDAQSLHETIRKTYGLHTALVPLFSASDGAKQTQPQAPLDVLQRMYGHLAAPKDERKVEALVTPAEEVVGLGYDVPDLPTSSPHPPTAPPAVSPIPAPSAVPEAEPLPSPDFVVPGHELSEADLTVLNKFVREMVVQSVIPFMERSVIVGNEQFAASKRGIGGRLFSAGRKYFGGGSSSSAAGDASVGGSSASSRAGSPGPGGGGGGYNAVKGYYPSSSPPSQQRRLADLAFQLGDYKLAAQVYDSVAKDFKGDKAWRHYAGAVRMSGLSHLLLHPPSAALPSPSSPNSPDSALYLSSLAPSQSSTFDSLRASLLYYEVYRALSHPSGWALAPTGLLRAAEGIGEEVAAAVSLEQAAFADLRIGTGKGKGGKKRRYALHMAMAAARYEKCGIKSLSRRCLFQASTLYRISPSAATYSSAENDQPPSVASTSLSDPRLPAPSSSASPTLSNFTAVHTHLHHSLARQAYTVGAPLEAVSHFLQLLSASTARPGGGVQDEGEELDWLDDFALAWERLGSQNEAEQTAKEAGVGLPVKLFDAGGAKLKVGASVVSAGGEGGEELVGAEWERMGEAMCKGVDEREGLGWKGKGGKRPGGLEWRGASAAGKAGGKGQVEEAEAVVGGTSPCIPLSSPSPSAAIFAFWPGGNKLMRTSIRDAETFHLSLPIHNPLSSAFLSLSGLSIETDAPEGALEIDAPQQVELAPGEKSVINVPIRPVTLGSYTLLSLTYRFASLLPVTESLSSPSIRYTKPTLPLPGKPSVRAPCPLKVKVRSPVPCLSVDLAAHEGGDEGVGLPGKIFVGETLRKRIRVVNNGSVPITELHVLVDRPDLVVFLFPSPATDDSSSLYASSSSSPALTATIANHLRSPAPLPLLSTPNTVLQPGETLDVEVLCRGEAVGLIDVKWLFAFQVADDNISETFSTRAVHRMEVYPSLELRTAVQPNPRPGSPFILGIEAYNAGLPASDVRITSLSLISPRWGLSLAPGTSFEEDTAAPLGWQQGTTSFLSIDAAAAREGERDEAVDFTVQKVVSLLQGKEVGKSVPADVTLRASSVSLSSSPNPLSPDLLPSLLSGYNAHRLSTLRAALPTLPSTLVPSIFPLISSCSSAFLLAFYSSASLRTEGHLLVPLPLSSLGAGSGSPKDAPLRAVLDTADRTAGGGLYEESQRERAALLTALRRSELGGGSEDDVPVIVGVEVPEAVQHDYATGPCKAPIRFHLRNISPTTPLAYTLNLSNASSRGTTIAGSLTHSGTLAPLALSTISTQLWVPRPGVHRTGAWRIAVEASEDDGSVVNWVREGAGRKMRVRDSGKPLRRAPAAVVKPDAPLVEVQA
ncbi:hypothetical protein JCM11251_002063 [Rhodosporidiobolus azoricus]